VNPLAKFELKWTTSKADQCPQVYSHLMDTSEDSDHIHQLMLTASLVPRLIVGG